MMLYVIALALFASLVTSQVSCFPQGDFDLVFPNNSSSGVVTTSANIPELAKFSFCVWLNARFPKGLQTKGTVLSYYKDGNSSLQLYIVASGATVDMDGSWLVSSGKLSLEDKNWHHLCFTIDFPNNAVTTYTDGISMKGFLKVQGILKGGGCLVIAQDQGSKCGGFTDPYYGSISQLNIWNRVLSREEVHDVYKGCASRTGNVFSWNRREIEPRITGQVKVTPTTTACENNYVEGMFSRTPNMVLDGHVMSSHQVPDEFSCVSMCLHHRYCNSFNLRPHADGTQVCELKRMTKEDSPASFVSLQRAVYCQRLS